MEEGLDAVQRGWLASQAEHRQGRLCELQQPWNKRRRKVLRLAKGLPLAGETFEPGWGAGGRAAELVLDALEAPELPVELVKKGALVGAIREACERDARWGGPSLNRDGLEGLASATAARIQ